MQNYLLGSTRASAGCASHRDQISSATPRIQDFSLAKTSRQLGRVENPQPLINHDGKIRDGFGVVLPRAGMGLMVGEVSATSALAQVRLTLSEELVDGTWWGPDDVKATDASYPVSLERDLAISLGVSVGDTLRWRIQGVEVDTTVASLRHVDWGRMATNLFWRTTGSNCW